MKNEGGLSNDAIVMIVAVVLTIAGIITCIMMAPQAVQPAAPPTVVVSEPAMPEGAVTYADALPGAGQGGSAAGFGGGGGANPAAVPGAGAPPAGTLPAGAGGGGGGGFSVSQAGADSF